MKQYQLINTELQMKSIFRCIVMALTLLFLVSCEEEDNQPVATDRSKPATVSIQSVTSLPGGADITYTLPYDRNFSYVTAEVTEPNGRKITFNSSSYSGSIRILGLGTTELHTVRLYSVSKSEVKSEPTIIPITPLDPPYISVLKSLTYKETFGGVNIRFVNELKAECSITLGIIDDNEGFEEYGTAYVRDSLGNYSWRGMADEETKFGLYIRDRWDHYSDTIYFTLTPLFEEEINKSKFQMLRLPGDGPFFTAAELGGDYVSEKFLWDGKWSVDITNPYAPASWQSGGTNNKAEDVLAPTYFTFDMGANVKLSRVRANHYYAFRDHAPRYYEIWGCEATPPIDGSWDGWVKIAEIENIKPSGLPVGQIGAGDAEAWAMGDNADFDMDLPRIRYIRVKNLASWRENGRFNLAEITFYGEN